MSNIYHTKISFAANANASVFNAPLSQLDSWLYNVVSGVMLWQDLTDDPPAPDTFSLYFKNKELFWQNAAGVPKGIQQSIFSIVPFTELSSPVASFDVSASIPATYKHLWLRLRLRDDSVNVIPQQHGLRFNADSTATNYCSTYSYQAGLAKTAGGFTYLLAMFSAPSLETAGTFSTINLYIWDYANTSRYRYITYNGSIVTTASPSYFFGGGVWLNTAAAINRITLITNTGGVNFVAGSAYELFGIS